jgi:hypothetical protein
MTSPATNARYSGREKAVICRKVLRSFSYFCANWCYIEAKETGFPILFKLWPEQKRIIPALVWWRMVFIPKARQLGITWIVCAYSLWVVITQPMKLIVVISAKGDWAVEFLERVYFIMRRLPHWMLPPVEKDTTEVLRFSHKGGASTIKSLPTTESGAHSKTPDILVLDETCWNPYVGKIFNSSWPGVESAGGRIICISNSIKSAPGWGWTRKMVQDAIKGLNDFKVLFLSWDARPTRPGDFIERQKQAGMDDQDIKEQYPATVSDFLAATCGSYFGATLARHDEFMSDSKVRPVRGHIIKSKRTGDIDVEEDGRGPLSVWRWPYFELEDWDGYWWARRYAIGSDVSEGLGQSYSAAYVLDRHLDEIVCRLYSNRIDAVDWARLLYYLSLYYSNASAHGQKAAALICVERTGAGQTVVKELAKRSDADQYIQEISGKIGDPMTKQYGWHESEASKILLCDDLKQWFKTTRGGFYCPILLDEASTTVKHDGSRKIGPMDDKHMWDTVVGAGCAIQASNFLGAPPKQLQPPDEGWVKHWKEGGKSAWVK